MGTYPEAGKLWAVPVTLAAGDALHIPIGEFFILFLSLPAPVWQGGLILLRELWHYSQCALKFTVGNVHSSGLVDTALG